MLNYNEIAVIDDGINDGFYTNITRLSRSIEIHADCGIIEYKNNKIEFSHGTVCAAIICKYAKEAVISSVRILNERNKTTAAQLIKAVEWCLENNIGIVNLSLGSTDINEKENISCVINKAVYAGMIIVAASSNNGKITYPAAFSKVIGVKTLGQQYVGEGYLYHYRPVDGVDISAPSVHKLVNYFGEDESSSCNSFAAPYITAQVYNILKEAHSAYSPLEVKNMLFLKAANFEEIKEVSKASKSDLWYMDMNLCLSDRLNRSIDIPMLLVVGEKEKGMAAALKLEELFKLQGYRCGVYSDIDNCEMNYLPFKELYYEKTIQSDHIKGIISLFEIDIGIVFVEFNRLDINYLKVVEEVIENDIRIVVNNDKCNIIALSEEQESLKVPYGAKDVDEAFKYIMELYE